MNDPEWRERYLQILARINSSESRRNKISKANKEYYKTHQGIFTGKHHTDSTKKKISAVTSKTQKGSGNSQYGTCWISNTLIKKSIKIKKEFLYDYISEGWIKKRIIKW